MILCIMQIIAQQSIKMKHGHIICCCDASLLLSSSSDVDLILASFPLPSSSRFLFIWTILEHSDVARYTFAMAGYLGTVKLLKTKFLKWQAPFIKLTSILHISVG